MTMVIWKHELKTGLLSLIIWSCAISFLLGVCVLIYPEMAGQMGQISETFSQMGGFTQAFGTEFWGIYRVFWRGVRECVRAWRCSVCGSYGY